MNILLQNRLDNSHQNEIPRLHRIITAYLKIQGKYRPYVEDNKPFYWDADHFNLHKSTLFLQATDQQQYTILEKCSQDLISESYFVEKSAFAYCAKMMLLAENTEIAQVYSMIANEEAIHLEWITPYMDVDKRHGSPGEFFKFLSYLIETCDANLLPYLVQIILEGWGLQHYKKLAHGCLDERLKGVFLDIVRDEALHHHTGEVVFSARQATESQYFFIEECLKSYADMVRFGPQQVVNAIDEALGGINKKDRTQLLIEIEARATSIEKLALLKNLMVQPGIEPIVQKLDAEGYFTPGI